VVVNNLNDVAGLYRNEGIAPWLAVRLLGQAPNTRGIGARITIVGGPQQQSQVIACGERYLSSDESTAVCRRDDPLLTVQVRWPEGRETTLSNVPPNHRIEVIEPSAAGGSGTRTSPAGWRRSCETMASIPVGSGDSGIIRFIEVDASFGYEH
jgi:hypothetical protein